MNALIVSTIISFFTTFVITPYLIQFLYAANVVGLDLHKKKKPKLPVSGGICVAAGILAGLLSYVGIKTFVYGDQMNSINLLAVISSILIVTFVGLFDDLNVSSKMKKIKGYLDIRIGLPQWFKSLLTLPAAIPLMVISAGVTTMGIPFIGNINFGILYPLLIIPIGVVATSNAVNLLGGFNGSEAGMGIVYTLSLGIFALLLGIETSAVIFLTCSASLIAFLKYNWYPAKILPGDSLTYLLGSLVATGVIVGNMEKIGLIVMFPFIIEFFLKAGSRFKASCLGKVGKDGKMVPPYGKRIFSWTHIVMNLGKLTEKQVAIILIAIELCFAAIPFLM